MKTSIKSAAVIFGLALLSTGAFATEKSKTDTVKNDVSTSVTFFENTAGVDLTIDNATKNEDTLVISDADGNVVLTDNFTADTTKIQRSYLLDNIAEGDYTIAVSIGDKIAATTVTLTSDESKETYYSLQ